MAKTKNVPEIRFKGFEEEWEEKELGKVSSILKGHGYSRNDLVNQGTRIILYGRLYTKYQAVISEVDTYAIKKKESLLSSGNEVIVPASGETAEDIARASAITQPGILLGGDLNIIYPIKEIDSIFLAFNISNGKPHKELSQKAQGKTIVHLRNSDLKYVLISYTKLKEQTQIGSFFQNLDTLIALRQRKHEKLLAVKKSMLEKMFPKEGADVPEIRFKGFTGKWERKKISEIFKATRGYVLAFPDTSAKKTDENPYPVYSSQTKENGLMGFYKKYLYDTAITWTTDGANAGTVNFRKGKFYCTNVCGVLISSEGYANAMVAESLNLIAWKHVSKVGNPKLMNNVMSEIILTLPITIEEQTRIAAFFQNINSLIAHQKRELDKLKNIKKACLEKMFV